MNGEIEDSSNSNPDADEVLHYESDPDAVEDQEFDLAEDTEAQKPVMYYVRVVFLSIWKTLAMLVNMAGGAIMGGISILPVYIVYIGPRLGSLSSDHYHHTLPSSSSFIETMTDPGVITWLLQQPELATLIVYGAVAGGIVGAIKQIWVIGEGVFAGFSMALILYLLPICGINTITACQTLDDRSGAINYAMAGIAVGVILSLLWHNLMKRSTRRED